MLKLCFAFTALFLLITCQYTAAGQKPPSKAPLEEYLEAHNQARAEVGVGPLRWSHALTKSASLTARLQRDKHDCSFANISHRSFGSNQLWTWVGGAVAPRAAVEKWVEEKMFYDYANNSCQDDNHCEVYTQVVWKKSSEVGCAQAACPKDQSSLTICLYTPPGNVVGEKPY